MKVVAALMYLVLTVEAIPQKMALAGILVRFFSSDIHILFRILMTFQIDATIALSDWLEFDFSCFDW